MRRATLWSNKETDQHPYNLYAASRRSFRESIPSLVLLTRTGFPTTFPWLYLTRNPGLASDLSSSFPAASLLVTGVLVTVSAAIE